MLWAQHIQTCIPRGPELLCAALALKALKLIKRLACILAVQSERKYLTVMTLKEQNQGGQWNLEQKSSLTSEIWCKPSGKGNSSLEAFTRILSMVIVVHWKCTCVASEERGVRKHVLMIPPCKNSLHKARSVFSPCLLNNSLWWASILSNQREKSALRAGLRTAKVFEDQGDMDNEIFGIKRL